MPYTNAQKKQHIKEVQTYLYAISLFDSRIPQIIPDGIYGSETATAVRAFQREYGLPDTGKVDAATWNKIVAVYRNYQKSEPRPISCFPSAKYSLKPGDDGEIVDLIQVMLKAIGKRYDNFPEVTICGNFNNDTVQAVKMLQQKVGLPQNGVVDCKTWNMLVNCCENAHNTT